MDEIVGMREEDHRAPPAPPVSPPAIPGEWRLQLAPLSVPTLFIADSPELLATASAAYADWLEEEPAASTAIEIRLRTGSPSSDRVSLDISVEGSRLHLAGEGIEGSADAIARRGECLVPPRLVGDAPAFADTVGDPLLLFLLARAGRIPVHAAGIRLGGLACLLAGPSGSGKSSLALAAARRGLAVLSDDTIHVELQPRLRVWGFPRPIHILAAEAPAMRLGDRLRQGRLKAALPCPSRPPFWADEARLVLIERAERVALEPIARSSAVERLARLEPGFDLLPRESAAAADALAASGAWRLTLGRDPEAAVDCLQAAFAKS